MTNRALMLAALSDGETILHGVLFSDDSRVFMEGLEALGCPLEICEEDAVVSVKGIGGRFPNKKASGGACGAF